MRASKSGRFLYLSIRCLRKEKTQMIALNSFCQVVVLRDIDAFEKNTARRSRMFADSVPTKNQKERERKE